MSEFEQNTQVANKLHTTGEALGSLAFVAVAIEGPTEILPFMFLGALACSAPLAHKLGSYLGSRHSAE